jgi:hypothetical protein
MNGFDGLLRQFPATRYLLQFKYLPDNVWA